MSEHKELGRRLLEARYREDPCGTLPNALWKTLGQSRAMELHFHESDRLLDELLMWHGGNFGLYTARPGREGALSAGLERFDTLLVHERHRGLVPTEAYTNAAPYFRLRWNGQLPSFTLDPAYVLIDSQPRDEAGTIAALISSCYPGLKLETRDVLTWTSQATYCQPLWFEVERRDVRQPGRRSRPIASAISEYDREIGEVSLEWIQVLPRHQGHGIARSMVTETLRRSSLANMVTVSGRHDDPAAEGLYRACSFVGEDIWWVLSR